MTETMLSTPRRLDRDTVLHLPGDLAAAYLAVDAAYWDHRDQHAELSEGRILSIFDYASTWTWWERHPIGDELALLLSGEAVLLLEDALGDRSEVPLSAGMSAIIPAGSWHSARIAESATILFVTPTPARTEHRPV